MNDHIDYIENSHDFDAKILTNEEIAQLGKRLVDVETGIDDKKKALGILAHRGDLQAYGYLKQYAEQPDRELENGQNSHWESVPCFCMVTFVVMMIRTLCLPV